MCINDRRYLCCNECYVVSNERAEPTLTVQHIGAHGGKVMYFGSFFFGAELGFLNCDDICMCVVNKPFEHLEFLIRFMLTCCIMIFLSLLQLRLCACLVYVVMCLSLVCL